MRYLHDRNDAQADEPQNPSTGVKKLSRQGTWRMSNYSLARLNTAARQPCQKRSMSLCSTNYAGLTPAEIHRG